jgi:hypothetical protein
MLSLTQAVSRVASRLNKDANNATVAARIKNHINDVCLEKWHGYAWSFRYREYGIALSPRVTSGTLSATNGNSTVTASGTPFDTAIHAGAWLRFTGDTVQAWYRVRNVNSTSSIEIEPAYQGTTGASKAYELCKTDYLLPSELSDIGSIKITYDGVVLTPSHQLQSDRMDFPPLATGSPRDIRLLNQSQIYTSYTTGTLSGSSGSSTLTGVGTSWIANVTPGDEIVINGDSNTYRVHSVETDTSITLYNKLTASASGATYTASRKYGRIIRIWPCPDQPYVMFLKGLRAYSPLVNNGDTNELLLRYPHAVNEGAVWREAGSSPDPREDSLFQKSELMWGRAQSEDEQLFPLSNNRPIWDARQQCR